MMEDLRIIFFIDSMRSGGKERRLTELMKMLPGYNVQFELVVMDKNIHYKEVLDLGICIHYLIRKTKKDFSVFAQFYSICKNFKPHIIHCWDSMTAVYSIPASKLLKIKLVNGMIVDAPLQQNILNKNWLRGKLTFAFSDIVLANSKAGLSAYSAPQKKSLFIYNGFNFARFNKIQDSGEIKRKLNIDTTFVIGMVASFSSYKDYKTFFEAAQIIIERRNDVTFVAVGSDTDSVLSKDFISEKQIGRFRLLGKQSNTEALINAMDICVLCTFAEGISNSILEYMALAKPVIATDGGGTVELVEDEITGYLISPSNPIECAEKMEKLLNNSKLREDMGFAGQKRIISQFSIAIMVDQLISLYRKISKVGVSHHIHSEQINLR